ncbi:MAG TPA: hypothetical protein VIG06_12545 [Kofleriaceae bacterium]
MATLLTTATALAQAKGPLARPGWAKATPPKGWNELPGLAKSVAVTLEQSSSFGEVRGRAGAQAFAEPGTGAFYLSWLVADKPAPDKAAALRNALDAVRHSRIASSPDARSTEEITYTEVLNENLAEAVLEWRHVSNETLSMVRAFAWVSATGAPRLLKGECVVSTTDGKAPPAVEAACRQALAALSADVPAAERGAIGDLPAGTAAPAPGPDEVVPAQPPAEGTPAATPPSDTIGTPPTGDQKVLYTGPPAEPKSDSMSKWFLVLGGALLLAGLYLTWRARHRIAPVTPSVTPQPDPDPDPDPASDPASDPDSASDPDPDPGAEPAGSDPEPPETSDTDATTKEDKS